MKSKSEKIIADKLFLMNVPYVYEVPLKLKGYGYVRPDFKVLNLKERKVFYWEHFGMMDKSEYVKNASDKISLYMKYGIYPNDKLLVSYETQKQPLSTEQIQRLLQFHFDCQFQ